MTSPDPATGAILKSFGDSITQALAIDLSLSSLCYAKRKTPAELAERIDYAQADILNLASIDRSFDVIDACGVLHHMADPLQGWRILLTLLRPGGVMHLAFYSETGRSDVVATMPIASSTAARRLPASARPVPAMSSAVP